MTRSLFFINQYASTPDLGFAGRFYYLAKELNANGDDALLITSSSHHLLREKPDIKWLWKKDEFEGLRVLWLRTLSYKKANSPLRVLNWFIFMLYMPLLIFICGRPKRLYYSSPSPVAFIGAWVLAKISCCKTCFDVRDVWPSTLVDIGGVSQTHLFIKFLYFVERFCCSKSDYVTSNLANFNLRLSELGICEEKFTWVPNGVSLEEINKSCSESVISLPKYCENKFVIGYTGTFGEANALHHMLDVACSVQNDESILFLLYGHGKELKELKARAGLLGLENVYFNDSVAKKDVYRLQSLFDVVSVGAKPSPLYKYGVAPNKLYEYIYSGTPVIYYIDTPNYHPVSDASCGFEVDSSSVNQFVEAIYRLKAMDVETASSMVDAARAYIEKNHNYSVIYKRLLFKASSD